MLSPSSGRNHWGLPRGSYWLAQTTGRPCGYYGKVCCSMHDASQSGTAQSCRLVGSRDDGFVHLRGAQLGSRDSWGFTRGKGTLSTLWRHGQTASRMESTSQKGGIDISESTVILLIEAGLDNWVTPRESKVSAKGKGELQTYWITPEVDLLYTVKSSKSRSAGGASYGRHSLVDNSVSKEDEDRSIMNTVGPWADLSSRLDSCNVDPAEGVHEQLVRVLKMVIKHVAGLNVSMN